MLKVAIIALILSTLLSCGGTPPTRSNAQQFAIISEQADPAARRLTLLIRVSEPVTQSSVRSIAESMIANRRGEFGQIIVKSYLEGMTASDTPYAVSQLEDGFVRHRFSPLAETQKIPTH